MPILSYGEDAFTLHALTYGLSSILEQLGDPTPATDALVLFRPSFGRRSSAPAGRPRAEFGEPDALIGTPRGTYIVEAKWSSSGELEGSQIVLRPEQRRRHQVLRVYLDAWRSARPQSWERFADHVAPLLAERTPGIAPPRSGTRLAQSLDFVLRALQDMGPVAVVLLFTHPDREASIPRLQCEGFAIAQYGCPAHGESHFVTISE